MLDQPMQRHPATLEVNGNIFNGMGALAKNGAPKNNTDGNIIFSYEQLGVNTEAEAQAIIHAQPTGIFTGTCYLLSGETEIIPHIPPTKVEVHPILMDDLSRSTHIAFLIVLIPDPSS
jgi:hypothetical protein